MSGDADLIAEIEQLRQLIIALAQRVLAHVDLEARAAVGQDDEAGLAEIADADDAAGGDRVDARGFEIRSRRRGMRIDQLRDGMRGVELVRVRGKPRRMIASRFSRRCSIWTTSLLIASGHQAHQADRPQAGYHGPYSTTMPSSFSFR